MFGAFVLKAGRKTPLFQGFTQPLKRLQKSPETLLNSTVSSLSKENKKIE